MLSIGKFKYFLLFYYFIGRLKKIEKLYLIHLCDQVKLKYCYYQIRFTFQKINSGYHFKNVMGDMGMNDRETVRGSCNKELMVTWIRERIAGRRVDLRNKEEYQDLVVVWKWEWKQERVKDWHHLPSSFLVWATGWMKIPFTEIKNLKEEQVWVEDILNSVLDMLRLEVYSYIYIYTQGCLIFVKNKSC